MFYTLIFWILSLFIFDDFILNIKRKNSPRIILLMFVIWHFIAQILVGSFYVQYLYFKWIIFSITLFTIIFSYIYFCLIFKKNNIKFCDIKEKFFENLKSKSIFYITIILFSIIILFAKSGHFSDTTFYYEQSANYTRNLFVDSYIYVIPSFIYVYPSLDLEINLLWFNYFTPFVFFSLLLYVVDSFIFNNIKSFNFKHWLSILFINLSIFMISIFLLPVIISGNIAIQATLILLIFLFFKLKEYDCIWYTMIFMQFFSSTGALLTIVFSISIMLYFIFTKTRLFLLKQSPYFLLSVSTSIYLIASFLGINFLVNFSSYQNIIISAFFIFILTSSFLLFIFIKIYKHKFSDKWNSPLVKNIIFDKFIYKIIISCIYLASIIFISIYFSIIWKYIDHFNLISLITTLLLFSTLIIMSIFWNKNKYNLISHFFLFNTIIVSLILMIFNFLPDYPESSWRLLYATLSISRIEQIFPTLFIISVNLIYLFKTKNLHDSNLRLYIFSKKILINISNLYWINIAISSLFLALSSIPILLIYTVASFATPESVLLNFDNIGSNLMVYDEYTIKKLKEFNNNQKINSLISSSDYLTSAYLTTDNATYMFINDFYKWLGFQDYLVTLNHQFNTTGYYQSLYGMNIFEFGDNLKRYIQSLEWTKYIDVLFFWKGSEYYSLLNIDDTTTSNYTFLPQISIVAKNVDTLNLFLQYK